MGFAMSHLTHEEKMNIITQSLEAARVGNYEEEERLIKQMPMAPWLAKAAKEIFGAEHLAGWDLSAAEAEYGKDWLNK